jgi:hypothetical protein
MLTSQHEGGVGGGFEEREIDDAVDPGRRHSVDGPEVAIETILRLSKGDEKESLDTLERRSHPVDVAVVGHFNRNGSFEHRRIVGIADQQTLFDSGIGQTAGHTAPDSSGGPRDRESWKLAHGRLGVAIASGLGNQDLML